MRGALPLRRLGSGAGGDGSARGSGRRRTCKRRKRWRDEGFRLQGGGRVCGRGSEEEPVSRCEVLVIVSPGRKDFIFARFAPHRRACFVGECNSEEDVSASLIEFIEPVKRASEQVFLFVLW